MTIGKLLAAEREKRQLTQCQFAALLGISQPSLSRILRGKRVIKQWSVINRIANLTGKSEKFIAKLMAANGVNAQE